MYYIGIDLGTSAVKLLLMNQNGAIQKIVSKEYPVEYPKPGWSQQNPEEWYEKTVDGLNELLADYCKEEVAGISFGGQMHGLVILDKKDQVIRPAILWNDGRTTEETEYLNYKIGKEKLASHTGNIAFAGFTAPKLLWIRKHEPENFSRIDKIMLPKDYLSYRLTGIHSTDYSDASGTLLLDVKNKKWSNEMMEICGIRKEWMPVLYESHQVVGTLLPEVCQLLSLPSRCKVAAGAGDNAAAAIGTATVGEGQCNISLGTSGTIFISARQFVKDSNNALHAFAHADGNYHLLGCMLSAASCNKWWMEEILKTRDFVKEQQDIFELGKNQIFFLPYLMGERSPYNNPNARAVFFGMSMDTSREDMTQAVLEGVGFALRDSLEIAKRNGISIKCARICGGGAKSLLWRIIIANILNIKVESIRVEEGPAFGSAILAAVACKEYASVEEAANKLVMVTETLEPDAELSARYEEKYRKFKEIYPACKPVFEILKQ
ncbi:xylulokinase [Anaerosacchariphilus polymeriproducens]|uniref:Xylulose kinase n=1 Tax=Anaerosacchariphilus polymeriproducens TaxID=1812858 RepID=A0A371AW47_9FIRM|nr:xylulokinase [Anaerosacchariphilus polymeriproducens]RDU23798.1 xylulokinase [Anaerosacchariphilus polymeriproducens]